MLGPLLISLAVLGQSGDDDPRSLVTRLGASRYQDREAAATALEKLGRVALPALVEAKDAKDPEIRLRVNGLIGRIEGRLLTQATLVALDFDDAPLVDVVSTISQRAGIKLMLLPEMAPQWRDRRVTLREPEPLPFWKAVDRLCDAGLLQYNAGVQVFAQGRERSFPLYDGGMRPTAPFVDSGPFRVSVSGLHYQRDVMFPPAIREATARPGPNGAIVQPATPKATRAGTPQFSSQFHLQIQVVAEPRLAVAQNGTIRVTEAVDDLGQALIDNVSRNVVAQRSSAYFGMGAGSTLQFQTPLIRPERPGKSIRRVRGAIPVVVSTRKPDPIVIPLKAAGVRTGRNDECEVVVHDVKIQENTRQTMVELTIRPLSGGDGESMREIAARGPSASQQQIEVADGQGHLLTWFQTGYSSESDRMTITLIPQGGDPNQTPEELRYYGLVRAATEIEFEFSDLPLP